MGKWIDTGELWDKVFNPERSKAWEGVDAEAGTPEWNIAAAKIDVINNICHGVQLLNAAPRSDMDVAEKPIWRQGESVIHTDYSDGSASWDVKKWAKWVCPRCGWFVGEQYIPRERKPHNQHKSNFCSSCGQRIDWASVEGGNDNV